MSIKEISSVRVKDQCKSRLNDIKLRKKTGEVDKKKWKLSEKKSKLEKKFDVLNMRAGGKYGVMEKLNDNDFKNQ